MKFIRIPPSKTEGRSLGVALQKSDGYAWTFSVDLWKRVWILEFGRGYGYDWDWLDEDEDDED
mgnify:FL=1